MRDHLLRSASRATIGLLIAVQATLTGAAWPASSAQPVLAADRGYGGDRSRSALSVTVTEMGTQSQAAHGAERRRRRAPVRAAPIWHMARWHRDRPRVVVGVAVRQVRPGPPISRRARRSAFQRGALIAA